MKKLLFLLSTLMIGVMFQSCDKEDAKPEVEPEAPENGIEYVDLGLPSGTLWATCNYGADTPEDYGEYRRWDPVLEIMQGTLPTAKEWTELVQNCKVFTDTVNGVKGHVVRNMNNPSKYIFIPYAGYYKVSALDPTDEVPTEIGTEGWYMCHNDIGNDDNYVNVVMISEDAIRNYGGHYRTSVSKYNKTAVRFIKRKK